jgi:putative regulator of septum formation
MSSHASEGAQQPAPEGETPAAVGASAAPAETATAEARHAGADPADTGPADAGEGAEADPGACTLVTGVVSPDVRSPDLAVADAGAMTMVLDPEPDRGAGEPSHGDVFGGGGFDGDEFSDEQEPVSKLAIAALVTGVLALVPLAVTFGVAALAGIRRTGRRGRGMAIAALLAAAGWLIVGGAVGTVGALTHGFHKPVTIKYRESAVFKLRKGDCVDSPNGRLVSVLPCSSPHEAEVFGTFSLTASAWPGTAAVARAAKAGCASRLTGYINPQLAISLAQSYVYPNEVAWKAGTRTVICEVRASSGQLTGSVRGAA